VLTLTADPPRPQHPPQRLLGPRPARRGCHPASVEIDTQRPHALAGQEPLRQLANDNRLSLANTHVIALVAERTTTATIGLARRGLVLLLPLDPPALVAALLVRDRPQDPRREATVVRSEVYVASHGRKLRVAGLVYDLEELLKLLRLPMQPIEMPGHDRVDDTAAQIRKQPFVLAPSPLGQRSGMYPQQRTPLVVHVGRRGPDLVRDVMVAFGNRGGTTYHLIVRIRGESWLRCPSPWTDPSRIAM